MFAIAECRVDLAIAHHTDRLDGQARCITTDLDPTDDPTHGAKQLRDDARYVVTNLTLKLVQSLLKHSNLSTTDVTSTHTISLRLNGQQANLWRRYFLKVCSKFCNVEQIFNKLKHETEYARNPKWIKKAALQAAWYECLVAGEGFEPSTFGL